MWGNCNINNSIRLAVPEKTFAYRSVLRPLRLKRLTLSATGGVSAGYSPEIRPHLPKVTGANLSR